MVSTARLMKSLRSSWWQDLLVLSLVFIVLFGAFLGNRPLTVPDEGRYAEVPREMVSTGDYLTPRVDGFKYFEKPPLFYWMQSASLSAFGVNEWAIRLPNALMGLLGVLLVYGTARKLYTRRAGLLAGMSLGTFGLYSAMAHMVTLDMTVTVLISASLCSFLLGVQNPAGPSRSRWMWAMYACAALATLTKGLIGIIFPGMIVFTWILLTNQWSELKTYCIPTGFLLLCAIVLPWHILVQLEHPEFFRYYILDQQFLRYFTDLSQRQQPFWFLPAVLIGGLFPWTGFIVPAIINAWPKQLRQRVSVEKPTSTPQNKITPQKKINVLTLDSMNLYLLLWAGLIFIFFWKSNSQLIPYVLPIFPPLAILVAHYLDNIFDKPNTFGVYFGLGCCLLLSSILMIVGAVKLDLGQPTLQISFTLLCLTALLPLLVKWRSTLLNTLIMLSLSASLFFISINFSYPPTDTRSIKTLALQLKPLLQENDRVYSYQNYYQDLPVYLGRRITIVDYYGELWHGIEHSETPGLWLTVDEFWNRWSKPTQQYMILSLSDYEAISIQHKKKLFEIARNQHNILVSNYTKGPREL